MISDKGNVALFQAMKNCLPSLNYVVHFIDTVDLRYLATLKKNPPLSPGSLRLNMWQLYGWRRLEPETSMHIVILPAQT